MKRLVLLAFLATPALGEGALPALHDVSGVAADDVLNLRQAPNAQADIVSSLPSGATGIEVLAINEGWAQVNTPEGVAFAKASFLARQPGLDWYSLAQPITCFGTEPFWSLGLNPQTRLAVLSDPAGDSFLTLPALWPADPLAPVAAVQLSNGFVTLTPQICGDGMSDRSYGIAANLFLTAADGTPSRLSGCCSLARNGQ